MVLHVLGAGAIGTLVATQLSRNTSQQVKLIVRSRAFYNDLVEARQDLVVEREGLQLRANALDVEVLPAHRQVLPGNEHHPFVSERSIARDRMEDRRRQSLGPVTSLFVATKASAVLEAIQQMLPRLSTDSTIVLLQNGGGLVDRLINDLFPVETQRPNFVVGVNTHGAYVQNASKRKTSNGRRAINVEWAGVGSISFGVLPNLRTQEALRQMHAGNVDNPLVDLASDTTPTLDHLPLLPDTQGLRTTVSSLLACSPLQPTWLGLADLLHTQQAKIAVNCVVNPLSAIFDVRNGVLQETHELNDMIRAICKEVSTVFAAQALDSSSQSGAPTQSNVSSVDTHLRTSGEFPLGHPLSSRELVQQAQHVMRITSGNVSSTLADIRQGRADTEIGYMNGYVSRLGAMHGIPTPVNDSLVNMVAFKTRLNRIAKRQPPGIPKYLPSMRISERYGATYKPAGVRPRHGKHSKRKNQEGKKSAEAQTTQSEESSTSQDSTSDVR